MPDVTAAVPRRAEVPAHSEKSIIIETEKTLEHVLPPIVSLFPFLPEIYTEKAAPLIREGSEEKLVSSMFQIRSEHSLSLGDKAEGRNPFFSKLISSLLKGSSLSLDSSWCWMRPLPGEPRGEIIVLSPLTGVAAESTVEEINGLCSLYTGIVDAWYAMLLRMTGVE
ncbi:unnamed protein product [Acanthoscelides obtectus]|uniref:Uncharacterized protein n=1 Tax=Acanthoscelides obtectus TaxID=200917 RepID=A0A9P0LNK5_ACAOB|nr:unnamed protein product [Acanthoscelides obtectus]CAK1630503.1 hypothetical protein AOBTE_LOCUS6364 [Acanthoscelides obtectus]